MKRIGILTFHKSVNNGAVMQAYSLATRLKKEYPDCRVEIIDYHMPKILKSYRNTFFTYINGGSFVASLKRLNSLIHDPMKLKRLNTRTAIFEKAFKKLPLSDYSILEDSSDRLFQKINEEYDVLIVGSDAVWNYVVRGFPNSYFPDERVKCAKLSYAASCYGMDFLNCEKDKNEIGRILSGFDFLGVRDKATEDFIHWSCDGVESVHTCDPTAFLDTDSLPIDIDQLKKKMIKRGFNFDKPAIGIMGSQMMGRMVKKMYGRDYQIVSLYDYVHCADVNLYDIEPFEWAYVFRYFKLTFTTYFHGTMLSLRNGVPLICFALETEFSKHHVPKTLDLLQRLGYEDWYFATDYKEKNVRQIKEKADSLLSADIRCEITARMDEEAKNYFAFKSALDKIIQK